MTKEQILINRVAALEAEVLKYRYDKLTGLKGRADFSADFNLMFDSGQPFYLILADVNGLKKANTDGGYAAGDALLMRAVKKLKECNPTGYHSDLYRYAGDEFVLLFPFSREYHSEDLHCPSDMYCIATKSSEYFKTADDLFKATNDLLLERKEAYYKKHPNDRRIV